MKKGLLFLFLILMIMTSCDTFVEDKSFKDHASGHSLYYLEEWEDLDSFKQIGNWIRTNVKYQSEKYEEFSDPETTVTRGYGDCDDLAILFLNIAYVSLDLKGQLVALDQNRLERNIEGQFDEIIENHVLTRYDGIVYDSVSGIAFSNDPTTQFCEFDEVFSNDF